MTFVQEWEVTLSWGMTLVQEWKVTLVHEWEVTLSWGGGEAGPQVCQEWLGQWEDVSVILQTFPVITDSVAKSATRSIHSQQAPEADV